MPISNDISDANVVPELQVGCEGLEASQRRKRSSIDENRYLIENVNVRELNITPVVFGEWTGETSSPEKYYEELDELFRLRRPEKLISRETRGDIQVELEEAKELWPEEAEEPLRGDISETYTLSVDKDARGQRSKRDVIDPFRPRLLSLLLLITYE